jgi:hypothetical protein
MQSFIKYIFYEDAKYFIPGDSELLQLIKFMMNKEERNIVFDSNKNTIFNFIFIVKDFNKLLEGLKNLNVNAGSQKYRGQVDSLGYRISVIDLHFRESMYKHVLRLSNNKFNKPELFSFNNIHINIGNVRW